MASRYHDRTLALLGAEAPIGLQPVEPILQWSAENHVPLPAAFVEWVALDGQRLLEKYSNCDSYPFDTPTLVTTRDGVRGVVFERENQGNFTIIAPVDQGDDPAPLFAWCGEEPWIPYCPSLSDAIFAQVFDWQYWIGTPFEWAGEATLHLRSDACREYLEAHFTEVVSTRFRIEAVESQVYRFHRSLEERINLVNHPGGSDLLITGRATLVRALEEELLGKFAHDVLAQPYSSPRAACAFLGSRVELEKWLQLQLGCRQAPPASVLQRLADCHRSQPLQERAKYLQFPRTGDTFTIGGWSWGVKIHFARQNANWWWIEAVD